LEDFGKDRSRASNRQAYCKPCAVDVQMAYLKSHPASAEKQKTRVQTRHDDLMRKFNLLKAMRGCYDCGGFFPPEAMDWDHRPGTEKLFHVSDSFGTRNFESIVDEIAKCDLVCSNCHRVRTKKRKVLDKTGFPATSLLT
jgi:ribosomal protein L31